MIRVRAVLNGAGCLASVSVTGHAATSDRGSSVSVVCAAVTAVVRSCADAIARRASVRATGATTGPGDFRLELDADSAGEWLHGVTDVLLTGIGRIAGEAPLEVELTIEREEQRNGT